MNLNENGSGTGVADAPAAGGPDRRPKFGGDSGFQNELRRRVEQYFKDTGRRQRDCPQMYLKTAVVFAWLVSSYLLLLFAAGTWWLALPLAVSVGLAMGAVGFNVQHDGGHHAYSRRGWVNWLAAKALDLIGASSYLWHWKHAVLHHTYVNVSGHDSDIDLGFLGRLSPHQRRLWFHRWQHLYLWALYGWLTINWQLYVDFRTLARGRIAGHRYPRPKGWDLVTFIAGKAAFFSLAFAVPMLLHPVWAVLLLYLVASFVLGVVMSVVFQLAHCVPEAAFPPAPEGAAHLESSWAVHQAETTVDFARGSRLLSWFLGGLNFQVEHHLCPRVCHVHYPALSKVVEATCREFGVRYAAHKSFLAGLAAHYRWLRQMGQPQAA
jgi:linoleoyl-CoA desaturase